jgi:hypothetical protein
MADINPEIGERIKRAAAVTDKLIVKLDTLTNRIDTAKSNDNRELVEYYERQFAETSVDFMDGVEAILDDWYALRGEVRPPAEREFITPELLDHIHNTVVSVVQGLPLPEEPPLVSAAANLQTETPAQISGEFVPPRRRVDVTG